MIRSWKRLTTGLAAAALAAGLAAPAMAQSDYPNENITFVCAFPAGSGADVQVRYFAEKVAKVSGATIIVENRAGAAGNIAAEYVARAPADGYTVFVHAGNATAANMHMFKSPPVDVAKDLQVVAGLSTQAFMLTVGADSPYKTAEELTAAMKEKGDKASYATTAPTGRVMGALYRVAAGLDAVEVQYRTGPDSVNDMTSGVLDYGMHDAVFALSQQRENRFRILAVGTGERMKALPDIPTLKEAGYDIDLLVWWAAMVPTGTPEPVVTKLNGWFNTVLEDPETTKFLGQFGMDTYVATPEEGQKRLVEAIDEWGEYMRIAKIPPQ